MTIHIHHGPNGGYKTSHVCYKYVVECAYQGRDIVTNIRGLDNPERVRAIIEQATGKPTKPFKITNLSTHTRLTDLHKFQTFFHWVAPGSMILIDELSSIYPAELSEREMRAFNLPEDHPEFEEDENGFSRHKTVYEAFRMHRHMNWTIVITEPDINAVRKQIRGTSEDAWLHANLAFIGLKGRYKMSNHQAVNSGQMDGHIIAKKNSRIPKWVFSLYQSTSTGEVQDSTAGTPLWKNPKIVLPVSALLAFYLYIGIKHATGYESTFEKVTATNTDIQKDPISGGKDSSPPPGRNVNEVSPGISSHPLEHYSIYLTGYVYTSREHQYFIELKKGDNNYTLSYHDFLDYGYTLKPINECSAILQYKDFEQRLYCTPRLIPKQQMSKPADAVQGDFLAQAQQKGMDTFN